MRTTNEGELVKWAAKFYYNVYSEWMENYVGILLFSNYVKMYYKDVFVEWQEYNNWRS